jgi:peptidyl-prolyl cis-trans isomerase C
MVCFALAERGASLLSTERSPMKNYFQIASTLVIALIAAHLPAVAQEAATPAGNVNPAVLEVNGEKVYAAEISMTMQNIAAQVGGKENVEDEQALVQAATQRVVEQTLLAQEARRTNVQPNELRLAQMTQAVEQQAGGRESLESNLATFGMDHDGFVSFLRDLELTRSLIEKQISPTIQVSDEETRAFYDENQELFQAPEQVHVRHILFNAPLTADTDTAAATRAKAEDARKRAVAGEDFAELARELSEGPRASEGGDLGFIAQGQIAPQFANAAFALEIGGISPVVRTNFGFHVIKAEEKRPARTLTYDEVAEQVRGLLIQQKTGQAVGELVKTLGDKAEIVNLVDPEANAPAQP